MEPCMGAGAAEGRVEAWHEGTHPCRGRRGRPVGTSDSLSYMHLRAVLCRIMGLLKGEETSCPLGAGCAAGQNASQVLRGGVWQCWKPVDLEGATRALYGAASTGNWESSLAAEARS